MTKGAALRLFEVAYGGMPGAPAPAGGPGPIPSGTVALFAVLAHRSELTAEQQARVDEVMARPDGSAGAPIVVGFAGRHSPSPAPSVSVGTHNFIEAQARQVRQDIAVRVGSDVPGPLTIVFDPGDKIVAPYGAIAGEAVPRYRGGRYVGCDLHLYPATFRTGSDAVATMAHEMIHCFQGAFYPSEQALDDAALWVREGSAEWGSATLVGPDKLENDLWPLYLGDPGTSLFMRSYDAIGFYAHLEETGHSPWAQFREMWATTGNEAQFGVVGGGNADVLDSWAAGLTRKSQFGAAWDTTGPGITSTSAPETPLPVGEAPAAVVARPYTEKVYALALGTDLIDVAITGHARLGDGSVDDTDLAAKTYCLRADGCQCPDGSSPEDATPLSPSGAVLALTGGPAGATGTITGRALDCAAPGDGATWRLDSPSSYSGGASHTVVDAYACSALRGPWQATVHVTHDSATASDPPLDVTVPTTWTFDSSGRATPTIGPYQDTVFGSTHSITYFPVLELDQADGTITVVGLMGSEDGSPRIDVADELARFGEPVPLTPGEPPAC